MIRLKVLSAVAAVALALPVLVPQASLAQAPDPGANRAAGHPGGGARPGGGVRPGGGGARFNGGGYRGGGGGAVIGGAIAGAVIGGAIASQGYGPRYYGPSSYGAGPGYYDNGYGYDAVAVAPAPDGDDAVSYCVQTYRSYDLRSGTYMGNDGYRHPCP